jgi:hypothetical protein
MSREYCKAILPQKVKLSSAGLTMYAAHVIYVSLIDKIFFKNMAGALFASYAIDCQFNLNSMASASRVTLLAIKKCKIVTCTLDKIVRQTRTPVAVTVVVGSLESMYVYAFIQYLNGHSYRLS